jgi:hypothetical protein
MYDMSWDSSVGKVADYRLDDKGMIPSSGRIFHFAMTYYKL